MTSCSLLAFLLSVSLTKSQLHCLYSSTCNRARLQHVLLVAIPVLKPAIKSVEVSKVTW